MYCCLFFLSIKHLFQGLIEKMNYAACLSLKACTEDGSSTDPQDFKIIKLINRIKCLNYLL